MTGKIFDTLKFTDSNSRLTVFIRQMISSHFTHKKGPLLSLPYSGVATSVLIRVNSPFFCLDDRPCPEDFSYHAGGGGGLNWNRDAKRGAY